MTESIEGRTYTPGNSFRARAEARQRKYRSEVLKAPWEKYGHFLESGAADAGKNFIVESAFKAARSRQVAGKGVAQRTFNNMLSSQAMCFNLFAPLVLDLELATEALFPFLPGLKSVSEIVIEYTPEKEVFGDQSTLGGVDCDLLLEGHTADGAKMVCVIEAKFVEPEFSICGFRKPGRAKNGKAVCPEDVPIQNGIQQCLYTSKKKYKYWERTEQHELLKAGVLSQPGCPFSGSMWQIWVNHVLAHEEGTRRNAAKSMFAVLAPGKNNALLKEPNPINTYKTLISDSETVQFIDLDSFIDRLSTLVVDRDTESHDWVENLALRYAGI